ncbi:sensor histidine kinase [Clostridium formicaceticum]|uniref:histidine kinase n=1 Tax=Clostridium formicaceticum TaxID=1497 RepID=A0AAC9RR14_9CLOT|nr:sensor histidine kinase [Clostridium formicaceticum]AOY75056.1 hypothetical protein BJL90_03570 [Clostridium formicaceticum]ARE89478.1 Sensor histidine kinase TmoS [Clostridium formicaceticum]
MLKLKMSLKLKLILLVLLALIPLITLQLIRIRNQYKESIEEELKTSINFAETINLTFMNYLEESWAQQYAIGVAILSNPQWSSREIENYINNVFSEKKTFRRYSWVGSEGIVLASSSDALNGVNVQEMEFYTDIISGKERVVSNLGKSILDDDLVIHISRGIYVEDELKGILVGIMDIDKFSSIFNFQYVGASSGFGLIDTTGRIVYSHKHPNIPFHQRKINNDSPSLKALQGEIVTYDTAPSQFDGTNRLGVAYPMEKIGWASYYNVPTNEVIGKLLKSAKRDIVILLLTSIISLLLATMLGNRYAASIIKLKDAADEISKGNLKIKTKLTGKDEMAATSEAFNRMTEEINHQISQRDEIARLKTQFFSTVSHELKTPINIILGAIQLMESMDDFNKASIYKYINMQKQNSYRLLRLINNLIDISKIEGNQFVINPVNCDIVRLTEDITLSVVEYTKLKNIELIFDTDVEEKIMAVDPDKIERIVLNLVSNAIKFTQAGGKIEVNLRDKEAHIEISVKDTGIGIPEDMQQLIFQYFTQVDSSLRRKTEGSGIGLSLVKSLIDMHGGSIKVNSMLGEGSEFIIDLPVVLIDSVTQGSNETTFANVERINIEFSDIYL